MKKIGVKKLAAIAAGAVLVGTALAPLVSAAADQLQRSDVYDTTTGAPLLNVVGGSTGSISDFMWAGNGASAIARNAVTSTNVTCSGAAGGAGQCNVSLGDVALTVGGSITLENAKTYDSFLNSNTNQVEFVETLTESQLPHLYKDTKGIKYNGDTENITITEKIDVIADALFETDNDVEDLVLYVDNGDFMYSVDFGAGIPAYETNDDPLIGADPRFDDDANDNVLIPWFGESYLVDKVDMFNATGDYIKLIKAQEKEVYSEGDSFTVVGKAAYAGQTMTVTLTSVVEGAIGGLFEATFQLVDEEGNVVDTQTVMGDNYVTFLDAEGDEIVATDIYVEEVKAKIATLEGYVTMLRGTSVIDIYDGEVYPWDSEITSSSNVLWEAYVLEDNNRIAEMGVVNSAMVWDDDDPIYPMVGALVAGHEGATAWMLNDFAGIRFDGWQDETKAQVELGDGMLVYGDADEIEREVPFWFDAENGTALSGSDFEFNDEDIAYRIFLMEDGALGGENWAYDFNLENGDALNGGPGVGIAGAVVSLDGGGTYNCGAVAEGVYAGTVNGVDLYQGSEVPAPGTNTCNFRADGCFSAGQGDDFERDVQDTGNYLADIDALWNDCLFFNDGADPWDVPRIPGGGFIPFALEGSDDFDVEYVFFGNVTDDYYRLLLNGQVLPQGEFNDLSVALYGTEMDEDAMVQPFVDDFNFYVPDEEEIGGGGDNDYYTGVFGFSEPDAADFDFNVYINTETDKLHVFPNNNMDWPIRDVNYGGWGLGTNGIQLLLEEQEPSNRYAAAYTDFGTKLMVDDGLFTGVFPENRMEVAMTVIGKGTTESVTGGEDLTVGVGESATTTGGTRLTVQSVGTDCSCTGADGGTCTPSPSVCNVQAPGKVGVYTDKEAPAGRKLVVGAWAVNMYADPGLQDKLLAAGDWELYVADNGDIMASGYTEADTGRAMSEFIDQVDAFA